MWEWVLVGAAYAFGLLFFQLLGGLGAAARAIENWGRMSSTRRLERSGLSADGFARARLSGGRR